MNGIRCLVEPYNGFHEQNHKTRVLFTYAYDTATGKLISASVSDGSIDEPKTTTYNYSDKTSEKDKNLIESVVLPIATVTYDYDKFYRASYDVEVNNADILTTDFTFRESADGNSTSMVVETMTNVGNNWDTKLTYTYDDNGNIETISEDDVLKATYHYDELNQLEREDNVWHGKTIAYTYDNGGNIQLIEEYAYTSGALDGLTATNSYTYLYGDSNWKDKLTSYNGNTITYDAIGNPLSYYNGYAFTWQNGRQLATISGNGINASYKYDANGIRTSKAVGNVTTTYTLEGSNIVKETNGTDTLWYYYDASDSLIGFEFNGTPYFYVKNLQGDIIAITDESGTQVVTYLYDSWGKVLNTDGSLKDSIGEINPFRYRGYYYDTKTGLYYLQSRYYDPNMKRFINADGYVSTGQGVLNNNANAYCLNNPINYVDINGCKALSLNHFHKDAMLYGSSGGGANGWQPSPSAPNSGGREQGTSSAPPPPPLVDGTISFGVTFGIAPHVSATISFVIDKEWNSTVMGDITVNLSPDTSPSFFVSYTNAPTIDKLSGPSTAVSGSVNIGKVNVGYESMWFRDNINQNKIYSGGKIFIGRAGASAVDINFSKSYSWDLIDVYSNPNKYLYFNKLETRTAA